MKEKLVHYFTRAEKALWLSSVALITVSFWLFDRQSVLTLIASLVGVTSLIFCAKGNPVGQALMIAFSVLYGIISYSFAYYGEMITYLGMTLPMAAASLVSWLRHPFEGNKSQVRVRKLTRRDGYIAVLLSAAVTALFYFILRALGTANLVPSTVSVTTSFLAAYLTALRSPYYAAAYAANDLVLIVLWVLASFDERRYLAVVLCFCAFFANDLYGFVSWKRMEKAQHSAADTVKP